VSSFAAQVADWCHGVEGAVEAIFRASVQDVVAEMQKPAKAGGRMRIKTGFLRASLMGSASQMPTIDPTFRPIEGRTYPESGAVEALIAGADIEQPLYFGYTAAYAGHREYGAHGQPPDAFVRTAAQGWQQIVAKNEAELMRRLGLA
jgi:hypothetical protein